MHAYKTLTKCEYPENIQMHQLLQNIYKIYGLGTSSRKVVACFFMKYENASLILRQQPKFKYRTSI